LLTTLAALASAGAVQAAEPPQPVAVQALPAAPVIDGDAGEWPGAWIKIPVKPAVAKDERARLGLEETDYNVTGSLTVQLKAGVHKDRFYLAVRYPDQQADTETRQWVWRGERYGELKKHEDMFAVRFHLSGDYDRSMLAGRDYTADVWLWSAARTNPAGLADDMMHAIGPRMIEDAAEYEVQGVGTVYIAKSRDEGEPAYRNLRPPKQQTAPSLPAIEITGKASGSAADVAARGVWKAGHWQIEFGRALNTGQRDDVVFRPGKKLLGQIAVFNRGYAEHKSVSEPLLFDFSGVR